jgi:hypothetical protein
MNFPIGVRTALKITGFSIVKSPARTREGRSKRRPYELPSVRNLSIGAARHTVNLTKGIQNTAKKNLRKGSWQIDDRFCVVAVKLRYYIG